VNKEFGALTLDKGVGADVSIAKHRVVYRVAEIRSPFFSAGDITERESELGRHPDKIHPGGIPINSLDGPRRGLALDSSTHLVVDIK
jgi:hypothetical protein